MISPNKPARTRRKRVHYRGRPIGNREQKPDREARRVAAPNTAIGTRIARKGLRLEASQRCLTMARISSASTAVFASNRAADTISPKDLPGMADGCALRSPAVHGLRDWALVAAAAIAITVTVAWWVVLALWSVKALAYLF